MKILNMKKLRQLDLELKKAGDSDNFYTLKDAFNEELKKYLRSGNESYIFKMKTRDLLQFIDWCSSYRPMEPHQMLTRLSIVNDFLKMVQS